MKKDKKKTIRYGYNYRLAMVTIQTKLLQKSLWKVLNWYNGSSKTQFTTTDARTDVKYTISEKLRF